MAGETLSSRLRAVLEYDHIPKHRQAAYLSDACNLSESTARRLLSGQSKGSAALWKLADALDVCPRWLWEGRIARPHPRTLRIDAERCRGYPPEEADRLARYLLAVMTGHTRANNLMSLVQAGQISLVNACRLL